MKHNKNIITLLGLTALVGITTSSCDLKLYYPEFGSWPTSSNSSALVSVPPVIENSVDLSKDNEPEELEIFFFQLEHKDSQTQVGDSFMIKYGDIEILIDAGEQAVGTNVVRPIIDSIVTDGIIELCINTHTDSDHLGGFLGKKINSAYTGVFSSSNSIQYLIDSGYQSSTQLFKNYQTELNKRIENGTKYFTYEQTMTSTDAPNKFILGQDTYLQILDTKMYANNFSGSSSPNDYSVCTLLVHGQKKCLFMGDAEKKAETALLTYNTLPEIDLFKANHHGSNTSNSTNLLDVINPKYVMVDSTASNKYNIPTKEILDRLKNYTPEIYTPFLNGGIHTYLKKDSIRFSCDGFKQYNDGLNGAIKDGTIGSPIRIHDSEWYKSLS